MKLNTHYLKRISPKLLIAFLVAVTCTVVLLLQNFFALYNVTRDDILRMGETRAIQAAEEYAEYFQTSLDAMDLVAYTVDDMMQGGASNTMLELYLVSETERYKAAISEEYNAIYGVLRGKYMDGTGWLPGEDYTPTGRLWYKTIKKGGGRTVLVAPYVDAESGTIMMSVGKLLSDGESVVSMDLTIERLREITRSSVEGYPGDNYSLVLDSDGRIVSFAGNHNGNGGDEADGQTVAAMINDLTAIAPIEDSRSYEITFEGKDYLVYAESINDQWHAVSIMDEDTVFTSLREIEALSLVVMIVVLLLAFFLFFEMSKRQIRTQDLNTQLQSVAGIYTCLHIVDLPTDTYAEIRSNTEDVSRMLQGRNERAKDTMRIMLNYLTDPDSRNEMLEFADFDTLDERMKDTDTITVEFKNNKGRWCRGRFVVVERGLSGKLKKVLWMVEDIHSEKQKRERLQYLSETDLMTGINNRGSGEAKIRKYLLKGEGGMFILLDADKFKSINDEYGHEAGDKVLIEIASCLRRSFRDNDVVMRLGGDEFAAFAPLVYHREAGEIILERFMEKIRKIDIPDLMGRPVTVSVGVAFYRPSDRFSFEELYRRADRCTYLSKKHQESYVTYYNGEGPEE
ncbi:MAG: diguanylate cyclase [Lachnospiraceae bacterium]|nr:diguanylate cyclase [Lachnospiraceae bacterium]